MNKWLSVAAVVVLCLTLVVGIACGGGGEEEEEEGVTELKFGMGLPLTGAAGAAIGVPAKYAFSMAAEDIGVFTVGGKQYRWKLIFEDNLFTTAGGASSTTKFIFEHNIDFGHQAGCSPAMGGQSLFEEEGIIHDIAGCGPHVFGPDHPYTFQVAASYMEHAAAFLDWLTKEHPEVQRIAMVNTDEETGHTIADAVIKCADHFGLDVVTSEFIPMGTVELFPVATKVMASDPDMLVGDVSTFAIMKDMGYEGLASYPYVLKSNFEQQGWDKSKGYLIWSPFPYGELEVQWPEAAALVGEFEDRYGLELIPAAFWAVNVTYVMTHALEQAGTVDDTDKIIETMETGTFDTLVGPLHYGGEAVDGVGHLLMWPTPIVEVTGDNEFDVLAVYSTDETEAIVNEVYE